MDDYVVRLGRAPRSALGGAPPAGETIPMPSAPPVRRARLRGRYRVLLVAGLLTLGTHLVAPDALPGAVDTVVEAVSGPIESLEGEAHLRNATTALDSGWVEHGTYDLGATELEALDGDVAWGDLVTLEPCFGGTAAVLVARTVRGSISRLLVRGDDVGDTAGAASCPSDLSRPHPWHSNR